MSLRRSTRIRACNYYKEKENISDAPSWASAGANNARRPTTVTTAASSPKNTTEENSYTLGLQRPDGQVVPLRPSYVLGRSNQPPQLPKVDLGLTNANAIHVSKTACIVESVTSQQAVLVVPKSVTNKRVYKPKINRGGVIIPTQPGPFTIHVGDVLIFPTGHDYPNHSFPVVRVEATSSKEGESKTQTTKATKGRVLEPKQRQTVPPCSKTTDVETVTLPSKRPNQNADATKASLQPHQHEKIVTESPTKRSKPNGMPPPLPTAEPPFESASQPSIQANPLDEIKRREQEAWRAPELADRHKTKQGQDGNHIHAEDEDDEDDYFDCHEDMDAAHRANARPRDMHVTFANTYWKALCSDSPSIGAKMLHLLLDNQRLPTRKLCGDLIQLVTFGEDSNNSNNTSKMETHKTRRHLAYQYIEATLYQYPQIAYDRFGDAAGSDYWKNALEQLYTVKDDDSSPENQNMIAATLAQQVLSIKLFHRLLNGIIHRRDLSSSPILRDMDNYGHSATCKVAANVMAHVWVEWGSHLWTSSNLTPHVNALTDLLAKIMILLLQKFVLQTTSSTTTTETTSRYKIKKATTQSSQLPWKEATEILWNAMHSKMQLSPQHRNKQWTFNLKFYWIQSWKHPELEEALAKHLKLWKEYQQSHAK